MTLKQVHALKTAELKKLETLEQIVTLLEALKKDVDDDAVEWVVEQINEADE